MRQTATVRYGQMQYTEVFVTSAEDVEKMSLCVMRTQRGVEVGLVLSKPQPLEESQAANFPGEILHRATKQDIANLDRIETELEPKEKNFCQTKIKEFNLPMKLAGVEHLFGGDRIIFYFLAEGRVDFRTLVKDLANEYRTRIEMKQIGVRDEARLLADVEHCGRPLCCKAFMKNLEPVTMRMAKLQKTTLDPSKISGRCGRLMCCLRFEDEVYVDLKKTLPEKGAWVSTGSRSGIVVGGEVLGQTATIEEEGGRIAVIRVADIVERRAAEEKTRLVPPAPTAPTAPPASPASPASPAPPASAPPPESSAPEAPTEDGDGH